MISNDKADGKPCYILRLVRSSPRSVGGESADSINKHVEGRMALRYGTACESYVPGWVGEGVGVAGIVYLVHML